MLGISRWWSLSSILALGVAGWAGCVDASVQEGRASSDSITEVDHTSVKNQSIGNCWIYATAGWLEALHKAETGASKNTSESWLTYWHWFEQLLSRDVKEEMVTGGYFRDAAYLIERYGIVLEGDFIAEEVDSERSERQNEALGALNDSLKNGVLSNPVIREDREAVRQELDRVWRLDEATRRRIDDVFGKNASQTLNQSAAANNAALRNKIIPANQFEVRVKNLESQTWEKGTLADVIGVGTWRQDRQGAGAWVEVTYPTSASDRRAFWKRVQRALHDAQPVLTTWDVDFNAFVSDSRFSLSGLERLGPSPVGGHITVMHDYQALVPEIGLLPAGRRATAEEMEKALADETKIEFVRVKNSWGGLGSVATERGVLAGYHDLELTYLNGPIQACPKNEVTGVLDMDRCKSTIPLKHVVLPPGY